jgi:hypothetical protein
MRSSRALQVEGGGTEGKGRSAAKGITRPAGVAAGVRACARGTSGTGVGGSGMQACPQAKPGLRLFARVERAPLHILSAGLQGTGAEVPRALGELDELLDGGIVRSAGINAR